MMQKKQAGAAILAVLLVFLPVVFCSAVLVQAASGMVYSCTIQRCYAHPVTGVIEDSGGEASYATGQGMAEGAVYSSGIMEVTDSGTYYLTFRISLVDYTSNHSFSVQNVGDSGWSFVTPTVTANGSDGNGTTSDLCIAVPSENCIVRCSMYVTPMGRDVTFYFYPNNYTQGNRTDMTAAVVTENTVSENSIAKADTDGTAQSDADQTALEGDGVSSLQTEEESEQSSQLASTAASAETDSQMVSTIEESAAPVAESASDSELNSAQGLSLSTAADIEEENQSSGNDRISIVHLIVAVTASITISGLILMTAAAFIVCYFRKNWKRWGGFEDEEYDDADD